MPNAKKFLQRSMDLASKTEMFQRTPREAFEFHGKKSEFVKRMIFQRVGSHLRLAQIVFREAVAVDDKDSVGFQVGDVDLQRGGIHGDQDVNRVAGRVNFIRGKMELEAADAGNGSRRSANFRGIVRKGGDVIAVQRDGIRELVAGNLHAVAGIAREANDRLLDYFALVLDRWNFRECRHSSANPPLIEELPDYPWGARLSQRMRRCNERWLLKQPAGADTQGYHTGAYAAATESVEQHFSARWS